MQSIVIGRCAIARILFTGGQVFDGTGAEPAVADVTVQDGRIVEVGCGLDGDEAVDCAGRAVLPGLFDCHVHLTLTRLDALEWIAAPFSLQFYEAARNMRDTLRVGITTVRDAGGADLGIRLAQERGLAPGPRLRVSIRLISQTGGHGDSWEASGCSVPIFVAHPGRPDGVADGPDQARRKVRELVRAGADVIKIATTGGVFSPRDDPRHAHLRDDEIAAIVAEATAAGIGVMAHAQGNAGIKAAVRGGVRSVEHGFFLDEEAIAMMLERGTWLVPTLSAAEGVRQAVESGVPLRPGAEAKERVVAEATAASVRAAIAAGVKIAMGTDAPVYPHGKNLRELELLVEHGMTSAQALHAATGSAAQLMGLDGELGTLEPGKRADIVLADGDPADLIGLGERIRAVYQDGVLVSGGR
jgi:imidazolonepropionase-like amidohydrolase